MQLLLLDNKVLAGFLYGKFREAEADGIRIDCKAVSTLKAANISAYYLVEMLGILFDNAVEATKETGDKEIWIEITESKSAYIFCIRNPYPYVSYVEAEKWFQHDQSNKGIGRGLGLYQIKERSKVLGCGVGVGNIEVAGKNWIVFNIIIKKADME